MSQPNEPHRPILSAASTMFEYVIPVAVVVLFLLVGALFGQVENRQATIVVVNYERLTELYMAESIRRDIQVDEELGTRTGLYLATVGQIADEFADTTGTLVIMAEAVVGNDAALQDITDLVHLRAMERLRAQP